MPETESYLTNRRRYIEEWLKETYTIDKKVISFKWWLNYYLWKNGVK